MHSFNHSSATMHMKFCQILACVTRVATLGGGNFDPVNFLITSAVFLPETLITAIPDIPGPDDKA